MTNSTLQILFSVTASLAILLYLAPGVLRFGPQARRWAERGAMGVVGLGILAALTATLVWAMRG